MRSFTKRALSLILALMLCAGLLSGISFPASAATVDYVYGTPTEISKYTNVIYNWGTRGELATFLSPNAEDFYTKNNVTYSALSKLSGSSDTSVYTSELYIALKALVTNAQTKVTGYDDTRYLYRFTDCQGSAISDDSISCFYSGAAIGPDWDSGSTWNREHTWPNSKGDANGNGENDIMMLRPTDSSINSSRGNKAYGEVTSTSYYSPNNEAGGEYDLRGDVARIILYVYTRWPEDQTTDYMWGTDGVIESKEILLKWMEEDPVDTWEMGRNDSVQSITGTRNVYVDYPELAYLLFNEEVPADMTTPSGGEDVTPSYTVTAVSNNNSYGTVSLSDNVITASPATGCYVAGYTVTSGQATVAQSGNVFTVTPSSDCTVQINFAADPVSEETSVHFLSNNVLYGDRMKLMYAVYNPQGETYTITITANGETFGIVQGENQTINEKECEIYTSEYGVPLQNIETVITATLCVNGEIKDTLEYSVLEYLHEMQTKLGGDLKSVATEAKKTAMLNMYAAILRCAEKVQKVVSQDGVSTIGNYGYVYVTNGTINGKSGALLASSTTVTTENLAAENATGWQYQIVGSGNDFAALPAGGLTVGTDNIILKAVVGGESAETVTETLSVFGSTGTLTSDSKSISWTSGVITFTNNKGSSTTAIRTSDTDHYRAYKNSEITISTNSGTISKIVITCTSSAYATALATSVGDEAEANESVVTITLATPADSYTIASLSAQVRLKTVEVTAQIPGTYSP